MSAFIRTLQLVNYIMMELHVCGMASINSRLGMLLNRHGDSIETVKGIISEYVLIDCVQRMVQIKKSRRRKEG